MKLSNIRIIMHRDRFEGEKWSEWTPGINFYSQQFYSQQFDNDIRFDKSQVKETLKESTVLDKIFFKESGVIRQHKVFKLQEVK